MGAPRVGRPAGEAQQALPSRAQVLEAFGVPADQADAFTGWARERRRARTAGRERSGPGRQAVQEAEESEESE
eukprot:8952097-Lingulodinium_polyedra.AAC.1